MICLVCVTLGWFLYEWLVTTWMIVSISVFLSMIANFWLSFDACFLLKYLIFSLVFWLYYYGIWFFIFLFWTCCLFLFLAIFLWMLWSFINTILDLLCLECLALGWFLCEWLIIMWMIVSISVLLSFWCCQRGRESCKVHGIYFFCKLFSAKQWLQN